MDDFDAMYDDYCICRLWLGMDDFFAIYPDIDNAQLLVLGVLFELEHDMKW